MSEILLEAVVENLRRKVADVLKIKTSEFSLKSSFIELGGNSLSAIALANALRETALHLNVGSILTAHSLLDLATQLSKQDSARHSNYTATSSLFKRQFAGVVGPAGNSIALEPLRKKPKIIPHGEAGGFGSASYESRLFSAPITHIQLTLIHDGQSKTGTNMIYYGETYRLRDLPSVKNAWKDVVQSEPIFRTNFRLDSKRGLLEEQETAPFTWTEVVVYNESEYEKETQMMQSSSAISSSFKAVILVDLDMAQPPKVMVIWRVHHALIDGHSSKIVLRKLQKRLDGLPIGSGLSFANFAQKLHDFRSIHRRKGQAFWQQQKERYRGSNGILSLPHINRNTPSDTSQQTNISMRIPHQDLSQAAQSSGVTFASLCFSAWAMVLSKYTGSDTVSMGAVFSGRGLPLDGAVDVVGPTLNTLPLYIHLDQTIATKAFVNYIFQKMTETSEYEWTIPDDGYDRDFSSVFAVQLYEDECSRPLNSRLLCKPMKQMTTDIPVNVCIEADGHALFSFSGTYHRREAESITKMFHTALLSLLVPNLSLYETLDRLIPQSELKQLLRLGNCGTRSTSAASISDDLVSVFERAVSSVPNTIAIEKGSQLVTYADLHKLSDRIARFLRGVLEPGAVVCVHADRSINWILAIYGILKAGGIYCPLDSDIPSVLRESYYATAKAEIFLTTTKGQEGLLPTSQAFIISTEEILQGARITPRPERRTNHKAIDLQSHDANAYICFTSGSSGRPKGVLCTHKSLVAFQQDLEVRLFAQPGKRIAQVMSPAFDGSIHEIFSTLSYGATLVLGCSSDVLGNIGVVDTAILTPSLAMILNPSDYPHLETVYLVGETVSRVVCDTWATQKRLYNMYGPTEATCGATIKRLQPNRPITVGIPNPTTKVYLLDDRRSLVPRGVIGEIYLAGVQISNGYVGLPDETSKRFLKDSICEHLNEKMYYTGDRGYWNDDGEIVCLGRTDRQIKLRGFRLDLNDLEARILKAVSTATFVAMAKKDDYLVALLLPSGLNLVKVRSQIVKVLPSYAVPQKIAVVDVLPTTSAGKIDYKKVADHDFSTNVSEVLTFELSEVERRVASAWRIVLDLSEDVDITRTSNFLQLGGNSIPALLLSHRLSAEFHRRISLKSIIESPNLSELASSIATTSPINDVSSKLMLGAKAISPIEHEWWTKYQLGEDTSCFNVSFACAFDSRVSRTKLATAWNLVLSRHIILRCKYVEVNGIVNRVELGSFTTSQLCQGMILKEEINRPFFLQSEPPIRVLISESEMVAIASHIVCDLTTMRVLLRELQCFYNGQTLESPTKTYQQTSCWNDTAPQSTLDFWSDNLNAKSVNTYDIGNILHDKGGYTGSSAVFTVPTQTSHKIAQFAAMSNMSKHQILMAAVSLSLTYKSEKQHMILGAPYFNRASSDDLETVGLFLQPLPIQISYDPRSMESESSRPVFTPTQKSLDPFLLSVMSSSQASQSHEIAWHTLLEHLKIQSDQPNHSLFDVMVTYHESKSTPVLEIPGMTPLYTWTNGSKFKLMVEAQEVDVDTLIIRFEHDDQCFTSADVSLLFDLLTLSLDLMLQSVWYTNLKRKLRESVDGLNTLQQPENKVWFAKPLAHDS